MIYVKRWLKYYEELFPVQPNRLDLILELEKSFGAAVKLLSVECGPAQTSLKLAETHQDITVIDSHEEFISRILNNARKAGTGVHAFNMSSSDISRYFAKNYFNIIMCCNYRLIFLKNRSLVKKFLMDAKYLLTDGGYLILDLINFSKLDFNEQKVDLPVRKGKDVTLYSEIIRDNTTAQYKLYQRVVTADGKVFDDIKDEEVIPISCETLKSYANELGFTSIEFYSDYLRTPLSADSDKVICLLKK